VGSEQLMTHNFRTDMHGRKQIFTSEPEINRGNVLQVLEKAMNTHRQNRAEEATLEKYLRGIQPILDRQKKFNADVANNKIVFNIANQIVTFKTAEFAGEPILYVNRRSRKGVPKKIADLNAMMISEGKPSKDMEIAYWMFTCGVAYRLIVHDPNVGKRAFLDEAPFEMFVPDPRNTFVIRLNDVSKRVVAGVNYVYQDENGTESSIQYTVYTPNVTYTIQGSAAGVGKIVREDRHNFGMIPLVEYPCNPVYMGAFEVVLPILDAINLTQSNRLDGIEQFIQAIMVFEGVDITDEQLTALREQGALKLPTTMDGRSSRVYYLNEQLDQSQTQTLVDDMYQTVLEICGMPSQGNANTSDSSNNGAVIMKNGWWNSEARQLETEGMWKAAETETLRIVLKICDETNRLTGINLSDVEPKFYRRSYEDLLVRTQSFSTLRSAGCTSLQAFTYSKLSRDPESDAMQYDEYQEQQAQALDQAGGAAIGEDDLPEEEDAVGVATGSSSVDGTGHPKNSYAVCPVCHKTFKKRANNQRYDRPECRKKALRGPGDV